VQYFRGFVRLINSFFFTYESGHEGVAVVGSERISGQLAVHGLQHVLMVVGARRAREGCTSSQEGGRKGAGCLSI
jgi:hypothetical protein